MNEFKAGSANAGQKPMKLSPEDLEQVIGGISYDVDSLALPGDLAAGTCFDSPIQLEVDLSDWQEPDKFKVPFDGN